MQLYFTPPMCKCKVELHLPTLHYLEVVDFWKRNKAKKQEQEGFQTFLLSGLLLGFT